MEKVILVKDGKAKYVFGVDEKVEIRDDKIITDNFIIGDLNSSNTTIFRTTKELPIGFYGDKFMFDGNKFTKRADWDETLLDI